MLLYLVQQKSPMLYKRLFIILNKTVGCIRNFVLDWLPSWNSCCIWCMNAVPQSNHGNPDRFFGFWFDGSIIAGFESLNGLVLVHTIFESSETGAVHAIATGNEGDVRGESFEIETVDAIFAGFFGIMSSFTYVYVFWKAFTESQKLLQINWFARMDVRLVITLWMIPDIAAVIFCFVSLDCMHKRQESFDCTVAMKTHENIWNNLKVDERTLMQKWYDTSSNHESQLSKIENWKFLIINCVSVSKNYSHQFCFEYTGKQCSNSGWMIHAEYF